MAVYAVSMAGPTYPAAGYMAAQPRMTPHYGMSDGMGFGGGPGSVASGLINGYGGASPSGDGSSIHGPHPPSRKVHGLANEIEGLEEKYELLEQRNALLTKRLLTRRRRFIERTLISNARTNMQTFLKAWCDAMHELRLERQLDEQTAGLDQCQQVVKELGAALTQEQEARQAGEVSQRLVQDDLERVLEQEKKLKNAHKEQQVQLDLLEKRVQEAESCLMRSRAEAQGFVDGAERYARMLQEMDAEEEARRHHRAVQAASRGPSPRSSAARGGDLNGSESPLEYSVRLRSEASGVMRKAAGFLQPRRPRSPERAP